MGVQRLMRLLSVEEAEQVLADLYGQSAESFHMRGSGRGNLDFYREENEPDWASMTWYQTILSILSARLADLFQCTPPTYGEVTPGGIEMLLRRTRKNSPEALERDFVDLGSGSGAAALYSCLREPFAHCVGVEQDSIRSLKANWVRDSLEQMGVLEKGRVTLLHDDIGKVAPQIMRNAGVVLYNNLCFGNDTDRVAMRSFLTAPDGATIYVSRESSDWPLIDRPDVVMETITGVPTSRISKYEMAEFVIRRHKKAATMRNGEHVNSKCRVPFTEIIKQDDLTGQLQYTSPASAQFHHAVMSSFVSAPSSVFGCPLHVADKNNIKRLGIHGLPGGAFGLRLQVRMDAMAENVHAPTPQSFC